MAEVEELVDELLVPVVELVGGLDDDDGDVVAELGNVVVP